MQQTIFGDVRPHGLPRAVPQSQSGFNKLQVDILSGLRSIPYFREVGETALARLAACAVPRNYPKNTIIINEGDEAGPLFIILSGRVQAYVGNPNGKIFTLSVLGEGSYFGELSILDDAPRSASIVALEPTTCALIPKHAFTDWLAACPPEAVMGLIRGLTGRIRMLTDVSRDLALSDVYGRLVKTLYSLAEPENDELVIRPKLSHEAMANLVGCAREMVTKIMNDLKKGGYLEVESKAIHIRRKLPPSW